MLYLCFLANKQPIETLTENPINDITKASLIISDQIFTSGIFGIGKLYRIN